jgi:hypothetical protein
VNRRFFRTAAVTLSVFAPCPTVAGSAGQTLPPGSSSLVYQCQSRNRCPTDCAWGDKVLFNTSDFHTLSFARFPDGSTLIRIDNGTNSTDYVTRSSEVMCRVSGSVLLDGSADTGDKSSHN